MPNGTENGTVPEYMFHGDGGGCVMSGPFKKYVPHPCPMATGHNLGTYLSIGTYPKHEAP